MDNSELIRSLSPILSNTPSLLLAYLFGSQVGETAGPLSDVDVGILVEAGEQTASLQARMAHELGKAVYPLRVDVILLYNASIELAYKVISQGSCIFQRDMLTRVEYEANVMSRYGDYLPVLRTQRQAIFEEYSNERRVQRYREALRRTERALSQIKTAPR
jgi:predicted nucleotidyltransferase